MKDREFIITKDWLIANSTKRGGYTKAQIKAVGLKYPLLSGWMNELIDKKITTRQASDFEDGKEVFSDNKKFTLKYKKVKHSLASMKKQELLQIKREIEELL